MARREDVPQLPHPRTKGSTGYPDSVKDPPKLPDKIAVFGAAEMVVAADALLTTKLYPAGTVGVKGPSTSNS
jgi:hypothetical protein